MAGAEKIQEPGSFGFGCMQASDKFPGDHIEKAEAAHKTDVISGLGEQEFGWNANLLTLGAFLFKGCALLTKLKSISTW